MLFEKSNVGICIDDVKEIKSAIGIILENYSFYQKSCIEFFEKMRFEVHHKKISDKIKSIFN